MQRKMNVMKAALAGVLLAASSFAADSNVGILMEKPLTGIPGKEGVVLTVDIPPGHAGTAHRHNADTFVYVLEGTVVMQVQGVPEKTLTAGQTFYESPSDVHTVSRNASKTQPAKLLVFFVKDKGAPITVPAK